MPDPVTGVIGGTAALGLYGQHEAGKAQQRGVDKSVEAQMKALGISEDRYQEFMDIISPYQEGGTAGFDQLMAQIGLGGEAMDLSQTPLYQSYLSDIRGQQDLAFEMGAERLEENLATQGLLGSGTGAAELMKLSREAYATPTAAEFMMPYITGVAQTGLSTATNIGSIGQGQAGQAGNILGNIGRTQMMGGQMKGQNIMGMVDVLGQGLGTYGGYKGWK